MPRRVDDVMNDSGHRLSTTEIESALVSHTAVAEAAVVAFVILRGEGTEGAGTAGTTDEEIITKLHDHVGKEIGPIAKPRRILVVAELPKTRSGKIMRRLLRDVAENRAVGNSMTLADASVMDLIASGLSRPSED